MQENIDKIEYALAELGIKAYHTSEYPRTNLILEINGAVYEFVLLENDLSNWQKTYRKILKGIS